MTASGSGTSGHGYMTPIGLFSGLHEGMDWRWSLYLFPFKHDHVISAKAGNRTVRDVIMGLKP
eukprot:COSAG02_NODE_1827_length_10743_cov_19.183859_5_plen_63_part_00